MVTTGAAPAAAPEFALPDEPDAPEEPDVPLEPEPEPEPDPDPEEAAEPPLPLLPTALLFTYVAPEVLVLLLVARGNAFAVLAAHGQ